MSQNLVTLCLEGFDGVLVRHVVAGEDDADPTDKFKVSPENCCCFLKNLLAELREVNAKWRPNFRKEKSSGLGEG